MSINHRMPFDAGENRQVYPSMLDEQPKYWYIIQAVCV